jgi:CubicO group peptidase (beta-lactamase class C family)
MPFIDRSDLDAIIPRIPATLAVLKVPGMAIAAFGAGWFWKQNFGVRHATEGGAVMDRTVFEAASLSKPIAAYAVLKLAERGLIDLDATLDSYRETPYLAGDPHAGAITVRHVLSHRTGLPNWRGDQPLASRWPSGSQWGYSGEGFVYLQQVAESIVHEPFADHLAERVITPLGLNDTSLTWMHRYESQCAHPHDAEGQPQEKRRPDQGNIAFTLHTTAGDFARFMREMLQPRRDPYHLDAPLTEAMLSSQGAVTINGAEQEFLSWGLGWGLLASGKDTIFWHWGDNGGFQCFAAGSKAEHSGIVIMTNGTPGMRAYATVLRALTDTLEPVFGFLEVWYGKPLFAAAEGSTGA